ncbi:cell division protein FtsB [Parachitinimonas caeni]|uniref:Cell division protein FtsB n=1 Tax=Parachitinimonas caeni TaxID=3031301 RepID=A0ABT7E0A0_9NEIS|nr:cell division protein FtsB [Parachitinimonas caeni]MDK2125734.1 cell division protein FtsB [Parachitinimonas caeni]
MRLLAIALASLIVLLQWPLWVGKGSWLKVWQIESQLADQVKQNQQLKSRNQALDAEVNDLKTGVSAIEERARNELGMIRNDEVFFQILDRSEPLAEPSASRSPAASAERPALAPPAAASQTPLAGAEKISGPSAVTAPQP